MLDHLKIPEAPAGPELLHKFKVLNRSIRYLSDAEFRILLAVFDHTALVDKDTAAITLTDLERATGLSRPCVSYTAQALVDKGILSRSKGIPKEPFVYRIGFDRLEALGHALH